MLKHKNPFSFVEGLCRPKHKENPFGFVEGPNHEENPFSFVEGLFSTRVSILWQNTPPPPYKIAVGFYGENNGKGFVRLKGILE